MAMLNEMGGDIWLSHLGELLQRHWWSAFFLLLTLSTIAVFLGLTWWVRRRLKKMMEAQFHEDSELDELHPLGELDVEAMESIKQFRREIWDLSEADLQLSVEALNQKATLVVKAVAAVYHPDAPVPQYEASLIDLMGLVQRVSAKLTRLSTLLPFRYLGNRKISDYQRYYQVYQKINENPLVQVLRRNPTLFRLARWAVSLKNLGNPLYWAGRELSRESYFLMVRWFYLTFISQVGREAMRVFSGRRFQREEDRDIVLVGYKLFALPMHWGGPTPLEWSLWVSYVAGHSALESEAKVHVLSRCAQGKLPKDLDRHEITSRSGVRWYREGLELLLEGDKGAPPAKTRLIHAELDRLKEERSGGGRARTNAQEAQPIENDDQ